MKSLVLLPLLFLTACNFPMQTITPEILPATETPVSSSYGDCYYVWAEQDMPELSKKLEQALQAADPDLTGNAYAFGENCVYADGHHTFGAMETDFRVQVKVRDLKDERALGNWMYMALQIIEDLPAKDIQGPQPGRVQFHFVKNAMEDLNVNVPLNEYRKLTQDLRGADLFNYFYKNP